jgi:hypothetical protein
LAAIESVDRFPSPRKLAGYFVAPVAWLEEVPKPHFISHRSLPPAGERDVLIPAPPEPEDAD